MQKEYNKNGILLVARIRKLVYRGSEEELSWQAYLPSSAPGFSSKYKLFIQFWDNCSLL